MSKREVQRIHWVFRANFNGHLDDDVDFDPAVLYLVGQLTDVCTSFAFQLESAPTTGYRHFQGYLELTNRKRKTQILNTVYSFEFLAPIKGTVRQAWCYATKEDTRLAGPWILGEPTSLPVKEKVEDFVQSCFDGKTDYELFVKHPSTMARMYNVPQRIRMAMPKPIRKNPLEVYVFYGPPGTGKSAVARDLYPDIYVVPWSKQTWLTLSGHLAPHVLFEDFTGEMYLKQFNRYVDRYLEEVEIKCGFVYWLPDVILITTNALPHTWYKTEGRQDILGQIFRRISACYDFTNFTYDKWLLEKQIPPSYTCLELKQKYENFNNNFIM